MKLIIFGASGRCGRHLVKLAASRGHEVIAVVRRESTYEPAENVTRLQGDVLDPSFAIDTVSGGADAIASTLGMRYAHPWAKRRSPDDFVFRATSNIVDSMQKHGIDRLCMISAAGVGDSQAVLNVPMRVMLSCSNVGVAYADLDRTEAMLRDTSLDWQAVRPVTLTNGRHKGDAKVEYAYGALAMIPRRTVAAFMLSQLEQPRFEMRTPIIRG